jgi:hypothetical protein
MDAKDKIEWAKQLLDQRKYRHEAFVKLVFRYCWYSLVGAIR